MEHNKPLVFRLDQVSQSLVNRERSVLDLFQYRLWDNHIIKALRVLQQVDRMQDDIRVQDQVMWFSFSRGGWC
jgi:hypothetical protein